MIIPDAVEWRKFLTVKKTKQRESDSVFQGTKNNFPHLLAFALDNLILFLEH